MDAPKMTPTELPKGSHCVDCEHFSVCLTTGLRSGEESRCYDNNFQPV